MPISRDELKELIRDALSTPWLDGPSTFPSLSFHFVRNLSAIVRTIFGVKSLIFGARRGTRTPTPFGTRS